MERSLGECGAAGGELCSELSKVLGCDEVVLRTKEESQRQPFREGRL